MTGYFDLAGPYRTVDYAVEHLDVAIAYYDAGHMMFVHPASMQRFKRDLHGFVDANGH